VPVGTYALERHDTARHPRTFALVNPDLNIFHEAAPAGLGVCRTACLIHSGNVASQSRAACWWADALRAHGQPDVAQSVTALGRLLALLPWVTGHTLTVE